MYLLTQSKNGIAALELMRHLGVAYNTAWRIKQKLMQVMLERDNEKHLFGNIKIDDAYLGGELIGGKRGRGSENKTPFITTREEDKKSKPIDDAGLNHEVEIVGCGRKSNKDSNFSWLNIVLGNVKTALRGTYHSISAKHVPRYLGEFAYRFNRKFNLEGMISRLAYIALRTPPMPARFLTMAEKAW